MKHHLFSDVLVVKRVTVSIEKSKRLWNVVVFWGWAAQTQHGQHGLRVSSGSLFHARNEMNTVDNWQGLMGYHF